MDELDAILKAYLEDVRTAIFIEQAQLGIKGSGLSRATTRINKGHSDQYFLNGPGYLFTNFDGVGRKAGGFPPRNAIMNWMRTKPGFVPRSADGSFISYESAAFLIGRKIGQIGTDIHTGKRRGIDIDKILKVNLPPTGRKLAQAYARDLSLRIKQAKK